MLSSLSSFECRLRFLSSKIMKVDLIYVCIPGSFYIEEMVIEKYYRNSLAISDTDRAKM